MKQKTKKEVSEVTGTKEVHSISTSKPTGTPLPKGFDPDLPMNKQREYR